VGKPAAQEKDGGALRDELAADPTIGEESAKAFLDGREFSKVEQTFQDRCAMPSSLPPSNLIGVECNINCFFATKLPPRGTAGLGQEWPASAGLGQDGWRRGERPRHAAGVLLCFGQRVFVWFLTGPSFF
jgi:hypothetical protein